MGHIDERVEDHEGSDADDVNTDWVMEDCSDVLGRVIAGNNSIRQSWNAVKCNMWKAFFSNVRCKYWRQVGFQRRLILLSRAVKPLLMFHCTAWPPQQQVGKELDQLQRRMTAATLGLRPYPLEDPSCFRRRAARECSRIIGDQWWRKLWTNSCIRWQKHLDRDWGRQRLFFEDGVSPEKLSTCFAWAPLLTSTWDAAWIESHREYSQNIARNTRTSRLYRRARAGYVHTRWGEGIVWAKAVTEA